MSHSVGGQNDATIIDMPSTRRNSLQPTMKHSQQQGAVRSGKVVAAPKTNEYIKMIRLILTKLSKRKSPSACLLHYSRTEALYWDHDDTIDLLLKLRSVLTICENMGLHILNQRGPHITPAPSQSTSPVRSGSATHLPQSSAASSTISSASLSSEHRDANGSATNDLRAEFDAILQLLDDLTMNDCRYLATHPKPSRPPFMLQSIIIDIAVLLVQARDEIPALYKIGYSMLPAFETFPNTSLKVKLLSFFIDVLLPRLVKASTTHDYDRSKQKKQKRSDQAGQQFTKHSGRTPIINIQTPEGNETEMESSSSSTSTTTTTTTTATTSAKSSHINKSSPLTIDTQAMPGAQSLLSPTTPLSTSYTHSSLLVEPLQQVALFTPLLTFMIQYLDPYLDAQQSATEDLSTAYPGKSYSIFNFHKAIRFMMQHKPDIYLDMLQLVAYSTKEVRFKACQTLFHYYVVSLGHLVIAEPLPKFSALMEIEALDKERIAQQKQRRQQEQQQRQRPQSLVNSPFSDDHYGVSIDIPATSSPVHAAGINRKYGSNSSFTPQRSNTLEDWDQESSLAEEEKAHVWYPHMFVNNSTNKPADGVSSDTIQVLQITVPGSLTLLNDGVSDSYCSGCYKLITGFGLRCYQCKRNVHYQCYSCCLGSNDLDIMLYVKQGGIQKVVSPQFCHIPTQPRYEDVINDEDYQHVSRSATMNILGHRFCLVNLYTLLLCACCRLPLWGISQQGYRCTICNQFVHATCLDSSEHDPHNLLSTIQDCQPYRPLLESDTRISSTELTSSLMGYYGGMIPTTLNSLSQRSFEEVGTILNVLLLQDHILQFGFSAGCLLVESLSEPTDIDNDSKWSPYDPLLSGKDKKATVDMQRFSTSTAGRGLDTADIGSSLCCAIQKAIDLCLQCIRADSCHTSSFLADFMNNREWSPSSFECLLSREDYLFHVAAMMKSLTTSADMYISGSTPDSGSNSNSNNENESNVNVNHTSEGASSSELLPGNLHLNGYQELLQAPSSSFMLKNKSSQDSCDSYLSPEVDRHSSQAQAVLGRDTLLSWAMDNLFIRSRKVAEILLQHMLNLGLLERYDGSQTLFPLSADTKHSSQGAPELCIFPVPYAIDCSPHVETLINAVESCLDEDDIAINECGMLLLTRRCWPNPFVSRYTNERLMVAVLRWILLEDEKLTSLYAAFAASNSVQVPGVKHSKWAQSTQPNLFARMRGNTAGSDRDNTSPIQGRYNITGNGVAGGSSGSFGGTDANANGRQGHPLGAAGVSSGAGNIYVTARNALRDRYLATWMSAMHDMNPDEYASLLNDAIDEVVESVMKDSILSDLNSAVNFDDKKALTLQRFDLYMGYLVKLKSLGLTFSGLATIMKSQLDEAYRDFDALNIMKERIPIEIRALTKLFSNKGSASPKVYNRQSLVGDTSSPFDIISEMLLAQDDKLVDRGIQWLSLMVHLGAGIPSVSLAKIARSLVQARASISTTAEFIKLVWFQVVNGLGVVTSHAVIVDIIGYLNETALESLESKNRSESLSIQRLTSAQVLIRYSAALTCYVFNCPLVNISDFDIVPYFGDHISQSKQSLHAERAPPLQVDNNTPIIRCMLLYLQFDQLNVREIVVKMFYAVIYWGSGISNKPEFISKCVPNLVTAIWELLPPSHDDISDINLNLLMKLLNTDVMPFHACVYKVMEDPNWEIRYQGLDSLYGLFTKMDVAFQTKWLSLLSHLGPVFSSFIACIWDKEEKVRSKALALLRTFGMLHLRSAFRCWEAYFLTATDRQRRPLVNLMIQLNAMFPDWQVLQWESLLEAMEVKMPNATSGRILGRYTPSSLEVSDSSATDTNTSVIGDVDRPQKSLGQEKKGAASSKEATTSTNGDKDTVENCQRETAETENTNTLMLTLALQMLSNHLSIDLVQISRLKYLLVLHMGFHNCDRYNASGEWVVTFGIMHFQPDNPQQSAMMVACTRGLKKVMDSFAPLPAETVATMAPEVLERNKLKLAENSSPGVHFIDVTLKLFTSGINLAMLNNVILKSWLEIMLIVVYKHNILDRSFEHSIVSCMKQIIDLITKDIGEENKLLILEIMKCLLRQSDHLTAMVLSKQIQALGKLMTKCGKRTSEPVFLKAKQFLKCAFLRFAVAGLFVLLFKNQQVSETSSNDVDLFYVLRTVIDPEDIVPDEDQHHVVYLLDQPVRDVLDKLLKQQMDRKSFSTVLYNMSKYVETVHSHPYPEALLNDYADFVNLIVKYTADWRRSDWDINSLFTMSSVLLMEHPYHFQILLPAIQVLFRHGLRHCNVQAECIVNLMAAFSSIASIPGTPTENIFVETILEEIQLGLTIKQKLHKDTLLTLLQLVLWDCDDKYKQWYTSIENAYVGEAVSGKQRQPYFADKLEGQLETMVTYLKSSSTADHFTKKDFKSYNTVSHILAWMCNKDKNKMFRILHMLKLDETRHCLQFLNWFILCLLKNEYDPLLEIIYDSQEVMTELLVQIFNSVEINFDNPDPAFSYSASGEALVLCFLILKTWTLLDLRNSHLQFSRGGNPMENKPSFWISIWPAISRLLSSINPSTMNMTGNVGLSIWNMFLSLLQFLHMCRSEAVVSNAFDWCNTLDYIVSHASTMESHSNTSSRQQRKAMKFVSKNNEDGSIRYDSIDNSENSDKYDGRAGSGYKDNDDGENEDKEVEEEEEEDDRIPLDDFKQLSERIRNMFDIPSIEVPVVTLIDQLYLELKDIMRLQSTNTTYQDHWNTAPISSSSGFSL